ncbi:hypothetical protein LCGC14_1932310 [marine sediment metagenome]|uniref:Uncharacterized protein n=1 Tax=marine sediment metagenome TaxID=412755 RepID=A0A0F9FN69_9ZZZZ
MSDFTARLWSAAAMMAPQHSPHPWHVRLGGYRISLPIAATIPQWLANEWTAVMQEAVMVWARGGVLDPDFKFIDDMDDEMVDKRIAGYQKGYDKEWVRREVGGYWHDFDKQRMERYVFADMSMPLKRAIVSRWDGLHAQYLREHPGLNYAPDFGYYWRVTDGDVTVKIKMFETDHGEVPTKEISEDWETSGLPGALYGSDYSRAYSSESEMLWLYVEGVKLPDLRIKGTEET